MADLTSAERRKLDKMLAMDGGYVPNFNNRSFQELVDEAAGKNVDDEKYAFNGTSKANRLRAFWQLQDNHTVARLLGALIDCGNEVALFVRRGDLVAQCLPIIQRLQQTSPVPDLDAIEASLDAPGFDGLVRQIQEAIQRNEPATGLDRLHTPWPGGSLEKIWMSEVPGIWARSYRTTASTADGTMKDLVGRHRRLTRRRIQPALAQTRPSSIVGRPDQTPAVDHRARAPIGVGNQ